MRSYSVREVCRVLGIRPHVLRYWEEQVTIVTPLRTDSGHRRWTTDQLAILHRMKHHIVDLGMSVAAAEQQIIREASNGNAAGKAKIEQFRSALVALQEKAQSERTERAAGGSAAEDICGDSDPIAAGVLPPLPFYKIAPAVPQISYRVAPAADSGGTPRLAICHTAHLVYRSVGSEPVEISLTPNGNTLLSVAAETVRNEVTRRGTAVVWLILVARRSHAAVLSYLDENGWFGLPPALVQTVAVPVRYAASGNYLRLPPTISAIDQIVRSDQLRAWLAARGVSSVVFPAATGAAFGPILSATLTEQNEYGGTTVESGGRARLAAVDLPKFLECGLGLLHAGHWRREVDFLSPVADNKNCVWVYELDVGQTDNTSLSSSTAFPGQRPAPWSRRWPVELDLIVSGGLTSF